MGYSSESLFKIALACLSLDRRGGAQGGKRKGQRDGGKAYLETLGAMALQGPHQVANASRTTTLLPARADLNSVALFNSSVSICWLSSYPSLNDFREFGRYCKALCAPHTHVHSFTMPTDSS